ncbi:MAG: hypothetical protein WC528_03650 [Patescibacteria group bacterium]
MHYQAALKERLERLAKRREAQSVYNCPTVLEHFGEGNYMALGLLDQYAETDSPEEEKWWRHHQKECPQCRDLAAYHPFAIELLDRLSECSWFCRLFFTLVPSKKGKSINEIEVENLLLDHCRVCQECRPYKSLLLLEKNMENLKRIIRLYHSW